MKTYMLVIDNQYLNTTLNITVDMTDCNNTLPDPYNDTAEVTCGNCSGIIRDLSVEYAKHVHLYFSMIVCLFGSVANIFNIAVLTRKEMACAPINRILTGLAVADMLVMLEYIPFSYYYHIEQEAKGFSYWGAVFMLFHTNFTQILHTISICLTLTLAIWRYLAIGYPDQNHVLCSETRCTIGISLSYLLPFLLCVPTYLITKIQETKIIEDNETIYLHHLYLNRDYPVFKFWMYAVIIKLLPCCILTIITSWLIRTLFVAKKRKQVLRGYNICPSDLNAQNGKKTKAERRADRTTKMLIAVLLLFLITEFPQALFGFVIGLRGECVFISCYQDFGSVMDILALLNGSINFILYCWMNRMFRMTFGQLFRSKILAKWVPASNSDFYTTSNITDSTKL